jgi:hypothetical protein
MPAQDVRVILETARATLERLKALQTSLDQEQHPQAKVELTPEQRNARLEGLRTVVIDARDGLACRLPASSFTRLKQWVAKSIVPGIKVDLYDEQL